MRGSTSGAGATDREEAPGAGAGGREQRVRRGFDNDPRQLDRRALEAQIERQALPQLEVERRPRLGLEAERPRPERVRAADIHVLEGVPSIVPGSRGVALARGSVDQRELSG